MKKKIIKITSLSGFVCLFVIVYISGVPDYLKELSFEEQFAYPLNVDVKAVVKQYIHNKTFQFKPINYYSYEARTVFDTKCVTKKMKLVVLVKSHVDNFERRLAIRKTWGMENRFDAYILKTMFTVGMKEKSNTITDIKIKKEMDFYKDLIQINVLDNYFNNTIKTMLEFKWAYEQCDNADYYLFSDDDMYISMKNVLKMISEHDKQNKSVALYTGFLFNSHPQRHVTSKWYIDIKEYPYNKWPPYIAAGTYIVSNEAMKLMYLGSLFVKHFRFDDIYLAIVAKKIGIMPKHCNDIYYYYKRYSLHNYCDVVASHGYGETSRLLRVWNEQLKLGCV